MLSSARIERCTVLVGGRRNMASFMRSRFTLTACAVFVTVLNASLAPPVVADEIPPAEEANRAERVSIWKIEGAEVSDLQGRLEEISGEVEPSVEPILVPLPAPVVAVASGLGIAWILRKRLIRS